MFGEDDMTSDMPATPGVLALREELQAFFQQS